MCIVVAGILLPVSIVASWARTEILDEQAFVETFAPLSHHPDVQQVVITRASAAIGDAISIGSMTDELLGGVDGLELSAPTRAAIRLLEVPVAAGLQSIIDRTITRVVESDAFSAIWQRSLIASHRAFVAVATNDETSGASVDSAGALGINLGPIVEELRRSLTDQGFRFASAIPATDRTIVIVQSDSLLTVRSIYLLAAALGWWLPLICLALFVAGILIAPRRKTALCGTGIALALGAALLIGSVTATRSALGRDEADLPSDALDALFFSAAGGIRDTAIVLVIIGVALVLGTWLSGAGLRAERHRAFADAPAR